MTTIDHFEQNRPVHLARRDVYFERAMELILGRQADFSVEIRMEEYEEILFLLRIARQHARFAIRVARANEEDGEFGRFINLLAGNVKAILSMLNLKRMVEHSEGSIFSFLGENRASVALQAEEYQRRANDIIRSIHNTLRLADEPFQKLKADYATRENKENMARYRKARNHFTQLIKTGKHSYKPAPRVRQITDR